MKNINFLLLIVFLAILTFGQFERVQLTSSVAFFMHDLFLVLWLSFVFVFRADFRQYLKQGIGRVKQQKTIILLVVWMVLGLSVVAVNQQLIIIPVFYILRLILYALWGALLFFGKKARFWTGYQLSWSFLLYGAVILYFGFLQYFLLPDTRWLFFLGWDDHYYRLLSTLLDPGFTGLIFVLSFCGLQAVPISHRFWSRLKIGGSMLFMVGILLTYSRASYLAFLVALLVGVWALWQRRRFSSLKFFCFYGMIFLVLIPLLPRPGGEGVQLARTSTVYARTTGIQVQLQSLKPGDLILGRGLFVQPDQHVSDYDVPNHANIPDNWLIFLLSGTGVVGTVLLCSLLWRLLRADYQQNSWLAAATMAVLTHGFFNASLVYPFVLLVLIGYHAALWPSILVKRNR